MNGNRLGTELITPTRIYVRSILAMLAEGVEIHSMAHITGGGLPENLPRCLNEGQSIEIDVNSWQVPPIFQWLAETGKVKEEAMLNTFNMGIGFALIVPPENASSIINWFQSQEIAAYQIGRVIPGDRSLIVS